MTFTEPLRRVAVATASSQGWDLRRLAPQAVA